ncbi:hypothetical protein F5Y03DRAFT_357467 [Xylaria venustula]|nr:hypothetical protein F5Y03DRAFT_357467 [Xylaria venustula]
MRLPSLLVSSVSSFPFPIPFPFFYFFVFVRTALLIRKPSGIIFFGGFRGVFGLVRYKNLIP